MGEISKKDISLSHQVPINCHSVMHICLTSDSSRYSDEKPKLSAASRKTRAIWNPFQNSILYLSLAAEESAFY